MANSVDPDQTAPVLEPHCLLLYFVSNARQLFAADDFNRRHFQMHFFLGALRVKRSRYKHESSFIIEFIKQVEKKRWQNLDVLIHAKNVIFK